MLLFVPCYHKHLNHIPKFRYIKTDIYIDIGASSKQTLGLIHSLLALIPVRIMEGWALSQLTFGDSGTTKKLQVNHNASVC